MKQRIITAAVLLIVFLPITIWGGLPFIVLTYVMATIGLYELFKMKKITFISFQGFLSILLLWIFLLPAHVYADVMNIGLSKVEFITIAALLLLSYTVMTKNQFTFDDVGFVIISILYVGIGFYYMILTREAGLVYLFYVLFVVWFTDSGAYFIGRRFGNRKLWPEISPNKTIGGFIGGILSAFIVAIGFLLFTDLNVPIVQLLLITALLSIFGQLGDLTESALKRHYGVKDSGSIFPGHGGILDRCDSWLFVLPLFYFLYGFSL